MRLILAFLLCLVIFPVQASSLPVFPLEIVTLDGSSKRFTVEFASTPETMMQGLMFRPSMPADAGMLFDFGVPPRPISMWMKNTLIPLDMLFISTDGHVLGIASHTTPGSLKAIASPGPIRAVLELNAGAAEREGITTGARILHPLFAE